MIKVSTTGMAVSLKTDLRFPISGQWGHGDRIIHLGSDNRDCVELGSEENDEAYISTYYTRKEINESFLFEVVQKHEYAYEMCQLQELIIKKQDERWILYLNDEVMGYVEVKKGFLIKEFCFVWDRQKIDQRRQLYE